ncbi:hypothetical protein DD630_33910 [Streptomyces sp. BSE7F]|nr:hypothetical protein DD630_33910 [Streptomyces sp. BSE7F]
MVVIVMLLPVLLVLMLFGLDVLERSLFPDTNPDPRVGLARPRAEGGAAGTHGGPDRTNRTPTCVCSARARTPAHRP